MVMHPNEFSISKENDSVNFIIFVRQRNQKIFSCMSCVGDFHGMKIEDDKCSLKVTKFSDNRHITFIIYFACICRKKVCKST